MAPIQSHVAEAGPTQRKQKKGAAARGGGYDAFITACIIISSG